MYILVCYYSSRLCQIMSVFVMPGKTFKPFLEVRKCALTWLERLYQSQEKLCTRRQEQQSLAPTEGTFLHPSPLGRRTMAKLVTCTLTTASDMLVYSALSRLQVQLCKLCSVF